MINMTEIGRNFRRESGNEKSGFRQDQGLAADDHDDKSPVISEPRKTYRISFQGRVGESQWGSFAPLYLKQEANKLSLFFRIFLYTDPIVVYSATTVLVIIPCGKKGEWLFLFLCFRFGVSL